MHLFHHRIHWHHLAIGITALIVGGTFILAYADLNIGNISPPPPAASVPVVPAPQPGWPAAPAPTPATTGDCRPTGCSGEICSDQDMASPCIYKPEYACYKSATCERGADGKCGWRETAELRSCLNGTRTTK